MHSYYSISIATLRLTHLQYEKSQGCNTKHVIIISFWVLKHIESSIVVSKITLDMVGPVLHGRLSSLKYQNILLKSSPNER